MVVRQRLLELAEHFFVIRAKVRRTGAIPAQGQEAIMRDRQLASLSSMVVTSTELDDDVTL
jgi:hypothetical protein